MQTDDATVVTSAQGLPISKIMSQPLNESNKPFNPYSKENETARKKKLAGENTVRIMMRAARTEAEKTAAKRASTTKNATRSRRAKRAAETRKENRTKHRKIQTAHEEEEEANTSGDGKMTGSFTSHTLAIYDKLAACLKKNVGFEQNGKHQPYGKWPVCLFGSPAVDLSSDPVVNFQAAPLAGEDGTDKLLCRSDFAIPPIMFYGPEDRWRSFYWPEYKPCCPFHPGSTTCVRHLGYSSYVRRAYGEKQNEGLCGRRYYCKQKKGEKNGPYTFYSYDSAVLNQAPEYVQGWWRQHGYKLTARGAIKWTVVEQMRSALAYERAQLY